MERERGHSSKNVTTCIRCLFFKSKDDFPKSSKLIFGIEKVCHDCKAKDFEVLDCIKGDKVIYNGQLSEILYFSHSDKNKRYCWVGPNEELNGVMKIYTPYLRKANEQKDGNKN